MHCKMCSLWKNADIGGEDNIYIEDWKAFLVSLNRFSERPMEVNFTGGEPFCVADKTLELIKFANQLGFVTSASSNGFLIDQAMAQRIKDSGLNNLTISLDSLDDKKHDYFRGREGAFRKAREAIENIRSVNHDIQIGVRAIIMEMNINDIHPITRWVSENNNINYICFQAIIQPMGDSTVQEWYKHDMYNGLWPKDIKKVNDLLDQLISLRESGSNNSYKIANPVSQLKMFKHYFKNPRAFMAKRNLCRIADFSINVGSHGSIYLCPLMEPIGDIKNPISELWYSIKSNKIRREIAYCRKNCNFLINCIQNN